VHRIDSQNNVNALPAPLAGVSAPGYFNNVVGAGAGTVVDPDWLNSTQEELVAIVLAAGLAPDKANNAQVLAALRALFSPGHGQCRLVYVSGVQLSLMPFNGNALRVNGKIYGIPAGGIAIANAGVEVAGVAGQNLAASTDYLLYVKDDGAGNLVPSFWPVAGGHMTDTTVGNAGVEVRNNGGVADSTRTLVGLVGTAGGSAFSDTDSARLLLSWFNPRPARSRSFFTPGSVSTASATAVELSATIRNYFLAWSNTEVAFQVNGSVSSSAVGGSPQTAVGFDGNAPEIESGSFNEPSGGGMTGNLAFAGRKTGLTEGRHYATLFGSNSGGAGGTGQWQGGNAAIGATNNAPCEITLTIGG
jgi:hypothetical protein